MRALKELVYILSRNKTKNIRQYGFLQDQSGRLMAFYNAMLEEKFNTDEEAAKVLLNTSPKDKKYRRLKNKFKEELLNALFFVDTSQGDYNDIQKAYYQCYKDWATQKTVKGRSAPILFFDVSETLLSKALKFDFTDIVFDVARSLKRKYASRIGNQKKYTYYNELVKKYFSIIQLEIEAENGYDEVTIHYARSKSSKPEISLIAKNTYDKIRSELGKIDSYRFNMYGYMVGVIMYMSKHDYRKTIDVCEEAIQYFDTRPYNHKVAKQIFLNQLTICATQLKLYDKAEISALRCIQLAEEGQSNWHRAKESYLLLLLHQGKFEQAYQVFQTARKHKSYKFLIDLDRERWQIYEAYIELLHEMNKVGAESKPNKKFKVTKFLNEVPTYTKDKRGYNIPILIVQFLFLVKRKKYDDAFQRIESLEKYGSRYLKKNDTYRTSCFIRMLTEFPKQGYQKKAIKENTKVLLEKMSEVPLEIADQANEVEVIPYEMLWRLGLEVL